MEGVAGITRWEQVSAGDPMFPECRSLYTEELNAAARGAFEAGAADVLLMDCHGAGKGYTFNSLIPEDIDERCEWVVQNEWTEYTSFLEEGCDAALFVGMHAMAGAPDGVLNHTVRGTMWRNLWFNEVLVGESGINAALCGTWGVPVLMVTGDRAVCAETRELLGEGLTTVEVKEGLGRFSARHISPKRARVLIEEGARRALSDLTAVRPWDPGSPCEVKVEFTTSDQAEPFVHRPNVELLDGRTIVSRADRWWDAWRQMYFGGD
jgi:D-amino peptidase